MKITVEIDEERLRRVMDLARKETRTAAIDYALSVAERVERKRRLLESRMSETDLADAVDPGYDLHRLRELEKP